MKFPFYILALFAFLSCSGDKKSTRSSVTDTGQNGTVTSNSQPDQRLSDKSVSANKVVASAGSWTYQEVVDKAGDQVFKASITSPRLIEFDFPYAGGSTVTLTIRKRVSGTNVYIEVSKGQFNRSFQGGAASIRFDSNPPVKHALLAAENGRANILFFDSEQTLINRIKAARNMTVELDFAGQGKRQIEFKTAGLRWNHS